MQKVILVLQIVVTNERWSYNSVVVNDRFHCTVKPVVRDNSFCDRKVVSEERAVPELHVNM